MSVNRDIDRMLDFLFEELLTVFGHALSHFGQPISQVRVQPKCPSDRIHRVPIPVRPHHMSNKH